MICCFENSEKTKHIHRIDFLQWSGLLTYWLNARVDGSGMRNRFDFISVIASMENASFVVTLWRRVDFFEIYILTLGTAISRLLFFFCCRFASIMCFDLLKRASRDSYTIELIISTNSGVIKLWRKKKLIDVWIIIFMWNSRERVIHLLFFFSEFSNAKRFTWQATTSLTC